MIQIHAPFPHRFVHGEDIDLDASNWYWLHCLSVPVDVPPQFSNRPYKWLRFAIGIILGAEGHLSSNPDSLDDMNYDASLSQDPAILYYHLSDDEKRRMLPLDPQIARSSISSSSVTPRRSSFRSDVAIRDGTHCVLSGFSARFCDAAHLLAHSKGNAYISTFTERRSRDPAHNDVVHFADSVRNGLFLNKFFHVLLGQDLAFLATPNFAMDTPDVDLAGTPGERKYTAHLFQQVEELAGICSSGPIQISDSPDWPPRILFDAVYASAVFHHFATQALKDVISLFWDDTFYPNGATSRTQVEYKSLLDKRAAEKEEYRQHAVQRNERYENRHHPDTMDMLFVLPYILLSRDDMKAYADFAQEKAAEEHRMRVEEKVESWRKQICASTPPSLQ